MCPVVRIIILGASAVVPLPEDIRVEYVEDAGRNLNLLGVTESEPLSDRHTENPNRVCLKLSAAIRRNDAERRRQRVGLGAAFHRHPCGAKSGHVRVTPVESFYFVPQPGTSLIAQVAGHLEPTGGKPQSGESYGVLSPRGAIARGKIRITVVVVEPSRLRDLFVAREFLRLDKPGRVRGVPGTVLVVMLLLTVDADEELKVVGQVLGDRDLERIVFQVVPVNVD